MLVPVLAAPAANGLIKPCHHELPLVLLQLSLLLVARGLGEVMPVQPATRRVNCLRALCWSPLFAGFFLPAKLHILGEARPSPTR